MGAAQPLALALCLHTVGAGAANPRHVGAGEVLVMVAEGTAGAQWSAALHGAFLAPDPCTHIPTATAVLMV